MAYSQRGSRDRLRRNKSRSLTAIRKQCGWVRDNNGELMGGAK